MPSPKKPSLFSFRSGSRRPTAVGWDRQIQHGTLRSELDEPAELPAEFAQLSARFAELRAAYDAEEISRVEFAESLSVMTLTYVDGSVWTIGAATGQWYRRFTGTNRWEPAMPPEAGFTTQPPADVDPMDRWGSTTAPLVDNPEIPEMDPLGSVDTPFPSVSDKGSMAPAPPAASPRPAADSVWGSVPVVADDAQPPAGGYGIDDDSYLDDLGLPPELFSDEQ